MNPEIALSSGTVAQIVGAVLLAIFGVVFGKPILGAWRSRRKHEESAAEHAARATEHSARLVATDFRITDEAIERHAARAARAEKARDEALELVRAARDDVHEVRNAALVDIAAARREAKAEIQRIQHAAEARLMDAERRIEELMDQVRERDAHIAVLTSQHAECVRDNARLSAVLHARMDAQGFDPTKSATGE